MKWPRAKKARTPSIFHTNTPSGPYRAIGPEWQNLREKRHILVFGPPLWPEGSLRECEVPAEPLLTFRLARSLAFPKGTTLFIRCSGVQDLGHRIVLS